MVNEVLMFYKEKGVGNNNSFISAAQAPLSLGEGRGEASPWSCWRYLNFARGARSVAIQMEAHVDGKLFLMADSLNGQRLGEVSVKAKDGWQQLTTRIRKTSGVHALYLRFEDAGQEATATNTNRKQSLLTIAWLQFSR